MTKNSSGNIAWFQTHKGTFLSESSLLRNNSSDYKEDFNFANKLFVSSGDMLIRVNKPQRIPLLIVYRSSFPYSRQIVYFLKNKLSKNELENLSFLDEHTVAQKIRDNIVYYDYKHQMRDGSLCYFQSEEELDDELTVFSINECLQQVKRWIESTITGKILPEAPQENLYMHFRNCEGDKEFLLPSIFYSPNMTGGKFYFSESYFQSNSLFKNYVGVRIDGENLKGKLITQEFTVINSRILFAYTLSNNDFKKYQPAIDKFILEEKVIIGNWWETNIINKPFSTLQELINLLGNGNYEKGLIRLEPIKQNLIIQKELIYLGLRFKNRIGEYEWLFLKLRLKEKFNFGNAEFENMVNVLNSLYEISAIPSEKFTDEEFHKRNKGRVDRENIKEKKVAVIGCGSLGSEIADILAKAGVGKLKLIDNEIIKAHNVVRHLVGLRLLNSPKVESVKNIIENHNPFIEVKSMPINILDSDANEYLSSHEIGISTIANDDVEGFLNEKSVVNKNTVFYARALRGGKCARIFRVIPGKDACKHCLYLYSKEDNRIFKNIPTDDDLPLLSNECNNPVRPGSAADLKLISSITAKLVIEFLEKKDGDKNHWIWDTENILNLEGNVQPYFLYSDFIPIHPECYLCGKFRNVLIKESVIELIKSEVKKTKNNYETGGILLGHITENDLHINIATDAGPNALKSRSSYIRDEKYAQSRINEEFIKSEGKNIYLGEWHSHPISSNVPSSIDVKSMKEISESLLYNTNKPVLLICSSKLEIACTIHPVEREYYSQNYIVK